MEVVGRVARIRKELSVIRDELVKEAGKVLPEEFDWRPRPDMGARTAKGLLQEIGTMEKICMTWFIEGAMLPWESAVTWSGEDLPAVLGDLDTIRQTTWQFLESCSDADLDPSRAVPGPWHQYWGPTIALEEAFRWIARHEYYHLGQLIYNRWLLGHNPYKE